MKTVHCHIIRDRSKSVHSAVVQGGGLAAGYLWDTYSADSEDQNVSLSPSQAFYTGWPGDSTNHSPEVSSANHSTMTENHRGARAHYNIISGELKHMQVVIDKKTNR